MNNCLIKNIPSGSIVPSGNTGLSFPFNVSESTCMMTPEFYLILEQSTPENETPLFTHHPRFIEVSENDIA